MSDLKAIRTSSERRSERKAWRAEVLFRRGTRRATVQVSDISRFGARISGVFLVKPGDRFFIRLPGLNSVEARVAWVKDFEFGCEFIQPLHEAVLEARMRSGEIRRSLGQGT